MTLQALIQVRRQQDASFEIKSVRKMFSFYMLEPQDLPNEHSDLSAFKLRKGLIRSPRLSTNPMAYVLNTAAVIIREYKVVQNAKN